MATITSDPFLLGQESFVTETDGNSSTVWRIAKGKALTQNEKEIAGDYYNSALDKIDYAKIYNLKFGKNWIAKHGASDEWMAKALSNKSWKDIFKKATDKKSPNISFASIAESNLNWQSIANNTDANNRPTSSGKTYGRYPLNKDSKPFDYLQVSALEYRPQQFTSEKSKSQRQSGLGITEEAEARSMKLIGSVFLPMQPGLQESNSVGWNQDSINAIQAAGANISGSAVEGASKSVTEAAKGFGKSIGDETKSLLDNVDSRDVAGYFAGQAVGANVLGRTTGQIVNPNLELLFSGPSLRSFNYTYRFTPREDKEAQEIKKIIKFFKKNMAPKQNKGKVFLESPNVFKLKYFFKNGEEHPFLNKIKKCALQSCTVQYTPDGSYMTYDDGSMTSYELGLSFGELNPIYNHDIDDEDNSNMGF